MQALEPAHDDAAPRVLSWKSLAWLAQMRATDDDEAWPLYLWQTFFLKIIQGPPKLTMGNASGLVSLNRVQGHDSA